MSVTIVAELEGFRGEACLVQDEETQRFFVVSSVDTSTMFAGMSAMFGSGDIFSSIGGPETLVFPADKDGNVTDWGEVTGGRGVSREAAIRDLDAWLRDGAKDPWSWADESDEEVED